MQAPIDADALLGDLLATLARDLPLNPQCRHWLLEGLAALARGEAASLDAALGLRRHAGQSARLSRRLRLAARDAHLAEALAAVALTGDVSPWERCRRLTAEVRAFNRTWHVTRLLHAPRNDWPTVRRCLWAAAKLDMSLPESARALHDALKRTRGYSLHVENGKVLAYANNPNQRAD